MLFDKNLKNVTDVSMLEKMEAATTSHLNRLADKEKTTEVASKITDLENDVKMIQTRLKNLEK